VYQLVFMKQWLIILFIFIPLSTYAQRKSIPGKTANKPERIKALALLTGADTMRQSIHWPNITPKEFLDNL
jgi:predicted secreted protein